MRLECRGEKGSSRLLSNRLPEPLVLGQGVFKTRKIGTMFHSDLVVQIRCLLRLGRQANEVTRNDSFRPSFPSSSRLPSDEKGTSATMTTRTTATKTLRSELGTLSSASAPARSACSTAMRCDAHMSLESTEEPGASAGFGPGSIGSSKRDGGTSGGVDCATCIFVFRGEDPKLDALRLTPSRPLCS